MGYKEYVENMILESGLSETDALLQMLENADNDVESIQEIENYLTEASDKMLPAVSGGTTALFDPSAAKNALSKGKIALVGTALVAAVGVAGAKLRKAAKAKKQKLPQDIENTVSELEDEAQEIAAECKAGNMSKAQAMVAIKKIDTRMRVLAKKYNKMTAGAIVAKESVVAEICESVNAGEITTEQADELLSALYTEGKNWDDHKRWVQVNKDMRAAVREAKTLIKEGKGAEANKKVDECIKMLKDFRKDLASYDDSVADMLFGRILNSYCTCYRQMLWGLLTFGIGSFVVAIKDLIATLDGMWKIFKEDDEISLKMFNTYKTRLISLIDMGVKKLEKLKVEVKNEAESNADGESTNESVNAELLEMYNEGAIDDETFLELMEMVD